ncbi:MAG TPA: VOC family protein [Bauldia sp.]|nr:VOC family protein [Bauldia sp.]
MKGITQLAHVALKVKDIKRSLDFYVNRMGFDEMFHLNRDGKLWIVYLRVTDDQYIELFPDGEGDQVPPRGRTGVDHFCLGVDDLDAVIAQLRKAGIKLTAEKKEGADFNFQAWIADPDGNRIELMQIMPKAMQLSAIASLKKGNHKVPVYNV